ncbi:MAG: class I SAM-dependent methyltransferase [Saprospiraceae bacterium]|nr:class I SAM-dependent methyltransferase [Saprospiraceae bacterium]
MRIHQVLCEAVVACLIEIFEEQQYADKVLEKKLRSNSKWGARDRAFIAEHTYDIVRHFRWLQCVYEKPITSTTDWWQLLGLQLLRQGLELPNLEVWKSLAAQHWSDLETRCTPVRAVRHSIPDWLDELGQTELGEDWGATLHALNLPASVVLRTNTLKISRSELQAKLQLEGIETTLVGTVGLVLSSRKNVFQSKAFQAGWFEVQDASSQLVAPLLDLQPGQRVVDACAGAGGKTLHIADLLQNKGSVIALDTEAWKLEELSKRAKRAGVHIIDRRPITSAKTIKRLHESADRLLLDVPCSGLGVLKRNPDAKWKLTPEFMERVKTTQQDILSRYSLMLKPGGKMVYATCSVLPSENQQQIAQFLEHTSNRFELLTERAILPQEAGFDGFYMALLLRKE